MVLIVENVTGLQGCVVQVTGKVKGQGKLLGEVNTAANFDVCFNYNAFHI